MFLFLFGLERSQWGQGSSSTEISYHIPDKVGQPIEQRLHSADELQVFSLVHSLLDEENNKTGRDKGHGEDHTDGNQHIY